MRNLILAGAAAIAFTAAPAMAQDVAVDAEGNAYVLTDEQQVMYDGWPADRQTAYDGWPYEVQEYYWTLTPAQVEGWWVLTDDQRVSIYEMTPEARTQAWAQVAAQMNSAPAATASTTTATTTPAPASGTPAPRFVSKEVTQTTPAGYAAASGEEVPVCKGEQQDGCINSWDKNKTGNRPLEYWPGKPASEIDEPLPATKPAATKPGT
ncbi:hypothetical protein [Qipengyuania qiaonensis]|uniref:Secreted protein n=1 Tax=Qipengyuania qiaonensis TaxID=2867240 RepID=A0ABS7J4Q2_9SPHN|nr:hypothetical protein [Qipengyuania qiaonensis]MBX7480990.1 hypothetical protein [Qipengyuania qiaonensis]